eukprot:1188818-Prorocentrum_minimum.AAC.2
MSNKGMMIQSPHKVKVCAHRWARWWTTHLGGATFAKPFSFFVHLLALPRPPTPPYLTDQPSRVRVYETKLECSSCLGMRDASFEGWLRKLSSGAHSIGALDRNGDGRVVQAGFPSPPRANRFVERK